MSYVVSAVQFDGLKFSVILKPKTMQHNTLILSDGEDSFGVQVDTVMVLSELYMRWNLSKARITNLTSHHCPVLCQ
jgi:hypothetical protein